MKRMICLSAVLLSALLAVSLCSCDDEGTVPTDTPASEEVPSETAAEPLTLPDEVTEAPTEAPTDELTEAPTQPNTEPDTEPETDVPADNEILLGELLDELIVVINSDVSCDGVIDSLDQYTLEDHLYNGVAISEAAQLAADGNGDGVVTEEDIQFVVHEIISQKQE